MHTTRSPYALFVTLVSLGMLAAFLLTGCVPSTIVAPTLTSAPLATPLPAHCDPINVSTDGGQSILTLADGTQIYLAENTNIEIIPAGYCPGDEQHYILLNQGHVAVNSRSLQVNGSSSPARTAISPRWEKPAWSASTPVRTNFRLDCTNGTCTLAAKIDKLTSVGCGESAFLDPYGIFNGPFNVDPATLIPFGDWLQPRCAPAKTSTPKPATATPIPTVIPTLDMGATATAYCGSFNHQFPLTPCPTVKP